MKFGKQKISGKSFIADNRLGSKYALALGGYWKEKLIVEKKLTLIWKCQEKNLLYYSEVYVESSRTFTMELFLGK